MPYGTHGQTGHVNVAREHGIYQEGMMVLHRCNNRKCLNPEHLYAGTSSDNMRDRVLAGTQNTAKVTPEIVRQIRAFKGTRAETAAHFGTTEKIVKNIRTKKTWAWLT